MYREYFISTPLVYTAEPFRFDECKIYLRGNEERSFIDGPSAQKVDDAFDFVHVLVTYANIPGLCIQVRGQLEPGEFPKDPRLVKREDWTRWAFVRILLTEIPVVRLDEQQFQLVQKVLDSEAKPSNN